MLTEPQIQRYARQVLLKDVGGIGQERLLARAVEVHGSSEALAIAVTYLAAGGTPVRGEALSSPFVAGVALTSLNPDATVPAEVFVVLADDARWARGPSVVAVGGCVVAGACADCVRATIAALPQTDVESIQSVTVGAMAALLVQRLALTLRPTAPMALPSAHRFGPTGWVTSSPAACAAHHHDAR